MTLVVMWGKQLSYFDYDKVKERFNWFKKLNGE